jgi:hypothetical protein
MCWYNITMKAHLLSLQACKGYREAVSESCVTVISKLTLEHSGWVFKRGSKQNK